MKRISLAYFAWLMCLWSETLTAQGTAFTYQGVLNDSGAPAQGIYDLTFSLFSASNGPGQVGLTSTNVAVSVSNGGFTVVLDFGPGIFTGSDRWVEIGVRTNGLGDFTTLSPRQQLTASPYAITASNLTGVVGSSGLSGTYPSPVTLSNPTNNFSGDGSQLTGLNAANVTTGVLAVAQGGTAASTAPGALANLGAAASGANSDITSINGLNTPLSLAQGGTGAGTPYGALNNLGAASMAGSNNFSGVNTFIQPSNSFAGTFNGDGSALTALNAANISSGLMPINRGGTGAGSSSAARASLGAAASGANADITSLSGLGTPLSISQGGSGASTASNALFNLGAPSLMGNNIFTGVNFLTGSFSGDGSALIGLNAANISSGLVAVNRGGTGAGTAPGARASLGAAASGANSDITALSGLNTPLSISQGGTGGTTGSNALANLGGASLAGTNAFSSVNLLTNPANAFVGSFTGDGSGLANLNAANFTSGTLPNAQLAGTYSSAVSFGNPTNAFTGSFSGDGSALTGLSAANISSGALPVARGGTGAGTASNALVNLGAASLSASNTFGGVNTFSNRTNTFVGSFAGDGSGMTNLNAGNLSGGTLPNAQLAGTYSSALTLTNPANSFVGSFAGNGSGLTNVNASTVGGLAAASFWQLGGNAGTSPGVNFLGTIDGQPLVIASSGGVGINTNNPSGRSLAVNGTAGISSTNALEFGYDSPGKQANAGKIGYQTFTPGALDIVGAGTNGTSRRIKFWAEAGSTFNGQGTNTILTINNTVDEQTSVALAAPFSTWHVGQNKPSDAPLDFDCFFVYQDSAAITRLLITSDGRIGLNTNNPIYPLSLGNGAYCTAGGQWTSVSDRNAKEDFTTIDPKQVLAELAALPITQWKYKVETNGVRHLGPMAQDFHAAFGLGDDDRAIGSVDADGVALAAIQGLNELVKEKDEEIRRLKAKSSEFEARIKALETQKHP